MLSVIKAYVENYSQESGKAPITVELCVGGGDDDQGERILIANKNWKANSNI
ncbi:hypothetical protein [Nostoc sp.]|uniref:hypothetical protein n=1 Tax=Nostoc sp. TaxID=1180 RepID=UPI002FFC24BF